MATARSSPPSVRSSQALPRAFRLKRRALIRSLFDRSRDDVGTLAVGSIRLLYRVTSRAELAADVPLQVAFAPGRAVRRAVDRNRVKRILREVYRVHQHALVDLLSRSSGSGDGLLLMVLYRAHPEKAAAAIPRDLPAALGRLVRRLRIDAGPR